MKKLILSFLCMSSFFTYAQDKSYDIALGGGIYSSPSFKNVSSQKYFSADFDYNLTKRWTISSGFISGNFRYFDDIRSNFPEGILYSDNTNASGYELHTYAMAKYSFVSTKRFKLKLGAGVGLLSQRLEYPHLDAVAQSSYFQQSSFTDLEFPVSMEAFFFMNKRFAVGIKAGFSIEPDFPIVGTYGGPQLRYRF